MPNDKLSIWYHAVRWGVFACQQRITVAAQYGWSTEYDMSQLEALQDLEQFLKMSWDRWMDNLQIGQTAQEVK